MFIREIGARGNIRIPGDLLVALKVADYDSVELVYDNDIDAILIKKYSKKCCLCNSLCENLKIFKGKEICDSCNDGLKQLK